MGSKKETEKQNKEEKEEKKTEKILELIKNLTTVEIAELVENIKKEFGITESLNTFSNVSADTEGIEKKDKTETVEIVSLKIIKVSEEPGVSKLQCYKTISEIAKEFGNDVSIIQAKKIAEEQGTLISNIDTLRAKEVETRLKEKGIQVSFIPV